MVDTPRPNPDSTPDDLLRRYNTNENSYRMIRSDIGTILQRDPEFRDQFFEALNEGNPDFLATIASHPHVQQKYEAERNAQFKNRMKKFGYLAIKTAGAAFLLGGFFYIFASGITNNRFYTKDNREKLQINKTKIEEVKDRTIKLEDNYDSILERVIKLETQSANTTTTN